jgi:hypothetical protein
MRFLRFFLKKSTCLLKCVNFFAIANIFGAKNPNHPKKPSHINTCIVAGVHQVQPTFFKPHAQVKHFLLAAARRTHAPVENFLTRGVYECARRPFS